MASSSALIPIYTTRGDVGGFLAYPHIYNPLGEWIGWVTPEGYVFSVLGYFVGRMTKEPRILRKRGSDFTQPRRTPPAAPGHIRTPAHVPLPPQMAELSISEIDVLEEEPELLSPVDSGELREDLD